MLNFRLKNQLKIQFNHKELPFNPLLTCAGSGVNLSSSDGLGGLVDGIVEVVLGVLGAFSESLHCSTSTSTSSSGKRSTEMGPKVDRESILETHCLAKC